MWETSRFKKNSGSSAGNGNAGSGKGRRGARSMRMKRVQAEVVTDNGLGMPGTVVVSRLVLNDLSSRGVTVFSTESIELGQMVTFTIEHPHPLTVRGKVTYNALFGLNSRTYSKPRYPFRIQIEFDFLNDGEADAIREYIENLNRNDLVKAA